MKTRIIPISNLLGSNPGLSGRLLPNEKPRKHSYDNTPEIGGGCRLFSLRETASSADIDLEGILPTEEDVSRCGGYVIVNVGIPFMV